MSHVDSAAALVLDLPGDPLGLGAGPHSVCFVDWEELTPELADRFITDHLGDDFLDAVPEAFWRDDTTGRAMWLRPHLAPLALIGGPALCELGTSWADAGPASAVLFLDQSTTPAQVVGWDGSTLGGLVMVASALGALV